MGICKALAARDHCMTERCATCGEFPGIEFLQLWMRAPNPMLGGMVPITLLKAGFGHRVAAFLDSALLAELSQDEGMTPDAVVDKGQGD